MRGLGKVVSFVSFRAPVALVVLIGGGCRTLGPEFEEPDVQAIQAWESSLYGEVLVKSGASQIDQANWWTVFNDPVLNELVEIARKDSISLRIAGLRVLEARASLGAVESIRYPQLQQLGGGGNFVYTEDSDGNNDDFWTWQSAFTLGWESDFWGRFERGIESANAAFFGSIANQRDVQVLLTTQVVSTYFAYRTSRLQADIAHKNAQIQKRSFEITTQLYESGQQAELDLQQAKTQYLATEATIPQFELASLQSRNVLCLLLGRAPGDLPELPPTSAPLPTVERVPIDTMPASLLLQRPDVRAAAWSIAAQSPQVGIAESALYPVISLGGSFSGSGNSIGGTPDTFTLGIGPSFTWNLFDYGSIRNNVRVQDARLQQAIENFENVVLQAAQDVDNAALSLQKLRAQLEPLRGSLAAAQRSMELANVNYKEGYADFQRVLDAQRAVAAQASNELAVQGQLIAALVSFYGSLGMGWTDTPVEGLVPDSISETMELRTNWGDLLETPLPQSEE